MIALKLLSCVVLHLCHYNLLWLLMLIGFDNIALWYTCLAFVINGSYIININSIWIHKAEDEDKQNTKYENSIRHKKIKFSMNEQHDPGSESRSSRRVSSSYFLYSVVYDKIITLFWQINFLSTGQGNQIHFYLISTSFICNTCCVYDLVLWHYIVI
jgi:hypothetical protein